MTEAELLDFSDALGSRMAVAITNSGQILFLYSESDDLIEFEPQYTIHWGTQDTLWELRTGCHTYLFQLPNNIMKQWLQTSSNDIEMRKNALYYKESFLSNMVVYYRKYGQPRIAMISISRDWLETAKKDLNDRNPS